MSEGHMPAAQPGNGPGSRRWAFSAGWIPPESTGHEPAFTSRDVLCLLNTDPGEACVEATVHHSDRDPVGPYRISVGAGRVKHVRLNDLIDPEAVPLGEPYGLVLVSDVPVVAQLAHLDTRDGQRSGALLNGVPGG
ncbi:sensory rhodopsin transducer [Nesterenkonia sp. HG001]|uniref:sensory rhodopsin transducer n=1 Tax=Nesterenkonia sp. HG001 TaxID=2983207 RepID=UPI002AC3C255|nr:sensory rhodopsin transducer [Nesterenkonia sp. HG001]MDZ5078475.1 sensory rhodopsin transducer [Nesterenkonia sp. HG001]